MLNKTFEELTKNIDEALRTSAGVVINLDTFEIEKKLTDVEMTDVIMKEE